MTRLKHRRLQSDQTLQDVALAVHVPIATLWRYEACSDRIKIHILKKLAAYYGCPMEDLLGLCADPARPEEEVFHATS